MKGAIETCQTADGPGGVQGGVIVRKEFKCENCGEPVTGTEYNDECPVVKQHYECPKCGFRRHWAYGQVLPEDSEYEGGDEDGEV